MADNTPDQNGVQFALNRLSSLYSTRSASGPAIQSPVRELSVLNNADSHHPSSSLPIKPTLRITPDEAHVEYNVNLMKVYRYQIAPWLDLFDNDQPFGVAVLVLATQSKPIRSEVLRLAETVQTKERTELTQFHTTDSTHPESSIAAAHTAVSRAFQLLEEVTLDLIRFWETEGESQVGFRVVESFLPRFNGGSLPHIDDGSLVTEAAYWIAMRLVLSCALVSKTIVRIPPSKIAGDQPICDMKRETSLFARKAISLCVDAAMFSQDEDDDWLQQAYGYKRAELWKLLIHHFGTWFKQRPEGFQPIIELYARDGVYADNDFPVIAFTSGAALLANQLYHTGMLLLLQHKPRFWNSDSSNSNSMSILWHVHRICGIAIQNDGSATWDPCLVASLIIAARTLTHRGQQTAIVSTLESAQRLSGWNIAAHIEGLKSEWQLADE